MADLTTLALRYLKLYGPLALFLFTFLETSMLFPLLPSEVVVPAAAVLLITDPASFLVFLLAAGVGGTVGAFVPFCVFRGTRIGRIDRVRDRIDVSEERIDRGQEWFRKWGESSVLWGRFLPALRSVVSIPAGLARMDPLRFGAFTATGTVGFYAATGAVVYYGRQQPLIEAALSAAADRPTLTAAGLLTLLGAGVRLGYWQRRT
jgi:membrane protein DedA with SNARE-associated domain